MRGRTDKRKEERKPQPREQAPTKSLPKRLIELLTGGRSNDDQRKQ